MTAPGWQLTLGPAAAGWSRLSDLPDPALLRPLVERIAEAVGGCEPRVAASALSLGTSARLWSITLLAASAGEPIPDPASLQWTDTRGSITLGAQTLATLPMSKLGASVLGWQRSLHEAIVREYRVPEAVLWGNSAAGLAGVVGLDTAVTAVRTELLAQAPLAGHIRANRRTRTCCLFYRVGGGGLCGDCVFDRAPASRKS